MMREKKITRTKGIILILTGSILWGVSGTVAQYVFQEQHVSVEWLTAVRLLISGMLLLGFSYRKEKRNVWAIWKDKKDARSLTVFSIIGMVPLQYSFLAGIQHGNAATATVLQFLGPAVITCYLAIHSKRVPTLKESCVVFLAVLGTFLLVTHGDIHRLSISGWALFWGLFSAVALAFYTLQPHVLLAKWGANIVVGWGMLVGGLAFSFIHPPWEIEGHWSFSTYAGVVFIILFGTLIAFYFYLESLRYLSASETSSLSSAEPLSAAFLSVIWLGVTFDFVQWIGALFIISTIFILSAKKKDGKNVKEMGC
ncbi:DMT family transporter [Priestia megaterium]|uniref:DMT family transporter n=1 Tax=Priestia megaterium TaxID=1404 RepID=UPI003B75CD93